MFEALMAISAFVIAAAGLGVAWLTTSALRASDVRTDSQLRNHAAAIHALRTAATAKTPASLKAEVDDLRAALDVIRASNRKEFGALWGKMGGRGSNNGRVFDGDGAQLEGDDELQALLALQTAKPVQPPQ